MEQGQTLLIEQQKAQYERERQRPPQHSLPQYLNPLNQNGNNNKQFISVANQGSSPFSSQRQGSLHSLNELGNASPSSSSESLQHLKNQPQKFLPFYGSTVTATTHGSSTDHSFSSLQALHTIRFQVVVWNIGKLDVVAGTVPMTFRVSLFWNDVHYYNNNNNNNNENNTDLGAADDNTVATNASTSSVHVWKMHGRGRAFQQELKDVPGALEVPALSIMNVSTFELIGSPDVDMLCDHSRLMRWTAMYRATVVQGNPDLRVDNFPHDDHLISLQLAILSNRGPGQIWDRRYWKLGLATREDTRGSTRIPHGLMVDHVRLPGFGYDKKRGLEFHFKSLENHGVFDQHRPGESTDVYLRVSLHVLRESGYYDKNILPLLALMNIVAVSVLTFGDEEFFYRALITLNIAFVQMGIRMTTDSHLPNVDYEIRLQRLLNEFFVVLMALVLQAMVVYVLSKYYQVSGHVTNVLDWITAVLALAHSSITTSRYYHARQAARKRLELGWKGC